VLPGRPDTGAGTAALDAYRQTQFLLGSDLDLFSRAMNLQVSLVRDAYPSKYRSHGLAAVMALWSRSYSYLADAVLLTTRGSYASTLPLLRAATESIAAQEALRGGEGDEHTKWLLSTLQPNEHFKAIEVELGRFFAGEVLASDPVLRAVYRPVSDFGRPNFGASLLQVAPESNNLRLAVTFADAAFHLAWAEIVLGWLLALAARQLRVIVDAAPLFPVSAERRAAYEELQRSAYDALSRTERGRVEEVEDETGRRYLISNFRRSSGAAPKKVLL
jgi:hypothetical protein